MVQQTLNTTEGATFILIIAISLLSADNTYDLIQIQPVSCSIAVEKQFSGGSSLFRRFETKLGTRHYVIQVCTRAIFGFEYV
jgi:hypothetical protein